MRRLTAFLVPTLALGTLLATGCAEHRYQSNDPYYGSYGRYYGGEDPYYRQWLAERRYNYVEYNRLNQERQREYWEWRRRNEARFRDDPRFRTNADRVANSDIKHVTGCTADGQGNVYFVNMWTTPTPPKPFTGNIVKLDTEAGTSSVIASGLNFPNMDVVGPDGNLYFSADSVCPAAGIAGFCPQGGTIWKLALPHENDGDGDNNHNHRD